ncbi:hypothetical protein V5R04_03235 [Jonesiaceae bacterium BS-20]|uniref:Uncharacterized protein n=1 Tax=Jonesiaceae bacterium BS-20 TaxID=3120821 RepID=A0AAU7DX14_9MICO
MAKNITLWVSGVALISLGLAWQAIRTSVFYRDWANNNDFLGLFGVLLGWGFLVVGAGIIVKALAAKKVDQSEAAE